MPSFGGTTGTPITGVGTPLAQPYPPTLLSLQDFARVLGVAPLHFAGAVTPGLNPMVFPASGCSGIWHKYDWQNSDAVSLYQIAESIHTAEQEVANLIGYWPAPYWIEEEVHNYPRPFLRETFGLGYDVRGLNKSVQSGYGKLISAGVRAVSLVGTASVGVSLAYTDEDSDGFYETATIQLATALTNVSQIKVYFAQKDGVIEWEVRPVRSKAISGGVVTIILDSWLLIDPELYELPPTSDGEYVIDASTVANFVTSVDVYREYVDTSVASATFYWMPDHPGNNPIACPTCGTIGCTTCSYVTQDGCMSVRLHHEGEIVPYPAEYDAVEQAWQSRSWVNCIEPDIVKISYLSGDQSQEFLQGRSHEPLSFYWKQLIAWIVVARLDRPMCACGNLQTMHEWLSRDITMTGGGVSHFVTADAMNSPFGSRRGEVMAWRRLNKSGTEKRLSYALA